MHKPGRIRSSRWLSVALTCRGRALTVPGIARELQVEPGSLRSLVRTLVEEGILEPAASESRGQALTLSRRGEREVAKNEPADLATGLLQSGERLLLIGDRGPGVTAEFLESVARDPEFRWAARVDGTVKWIASFGQHGRAASDRAQAALLAAGTDAYTGRVDLFADAEALERYARELGTTAQSRPAISSRRSTSG